MGWFAAICVGAALLVAGCGDDEPTTSGPQQETGTAADVEGGSESTGGGGGKPERDRPASAPKGTTIVAGDSEFGEMLFGADDQAIYIFENDGKDESNCYEECAEAWPPVLTDGEPQAGDGIEQSLLGTTERSDGELQVTYDGQPLYFYAHEAPGEVRCHNVNLNGGFWWVVGPDGERLA